MNRTAYSSLPTDELITYALARDNRNDMETELAQRLMLACQMLEAEQQERYYSSDPGRQAKTAS